jgi:VWFA-related protein
MRIGVQVYLLTVASILGGIALAQQAPPADTAIRLNVEVSKSGKPVGGLTRNDFTLLDNKAPREITSFRAVGGDAPVEVVLVIDAVNMPSQAVSYSRQQLDAFLSKSGGELPHPVRLAILTDKGMQAQRGSSRDGKSIIAALDADTIGLRSIGRSSGFYGAEERVGDSLKGLMTLVDLESKVPGRKLVIWISPGWPLLTGPHIQLSSKQEEQILSSVVTISRLLRQADVTLYSIDPRGATEGVMSRFYYQEYVKGVSKPSQVDNADLSLQVLATQSGGLVLNGSNDIPGLMRQSIEDASAYYEITFTPAPAEGASDFHSIDVKVSQPGLIARTWEGYYPEP